MRTRLPGTLAERLVVAYQHWGGPATIDDLAAGCGFSVRTLQNRCREAETTAKACLDFLHCLKVVSERDRWDPDTDLRRYCSDPRTVARLVARGRLDRPRPPGIAEFVAAQRFLRPTRFRAQLLRLLCTSVPVTEVNPFAVPSPDRRAAARR